MTYFFPYSLVAVLAPLIGVKSVSVIKILNVENVRRKFLACNLDLLKKVDRIGECSGAAPAAAG